MSVINSSRHDQDGTAIEEVAITAVVGTIVILFITSMTVVLIYICVKRMRKLFSSDILSLAQLCINILYGIIHAILSI